MSVNIFRLTTARLTVSISFLRRNVLMLPAQLRSVFLSVTRKSASMFRALEMRLRFGIIATGSLKRLLWLLIDFLSGFSFYLLTYSFMSLILPHNAFLAYAWLFYLFLFFLSLATACCLYSRFSNSAQSFIQYMTSVFLWCYEEDYF